MAFQLDVPSRCLTAAWAHAVGVAPGLGTQPKQSPPDRRWARRAHESQVVRPEKSAEACLPSEANKLETMCELEEWGGVFGVLEHASPPAQTRVRNITLELCFRGKSPTVVQVLEGHVGQPSALAQRRSGPITGHDCPGGKRGRFT